MFRKRRNIISGLKMAGKETPINVNDSSSVVVYDKTKDKAACNEDSDEEPEVIHPRRPKNINISGTDHLHFGNTYVSYGIINVPNEAIGPKRKSVNLIDYLNLNDDITEKFNNRRPTVKFNQKPINITFNSQQAAIERQEQLKREQETKTCILAIYMFLGIMVLLLLIYLFFPVFLPKRKSNDPDMPQYYPDLNGFRPGNDLQIRSRGFAVNPDCQPDKYNINPFRKKTRVRLVITKSLVFLCSYNKDFCYDELQEEYELHKSNKFNDIYYNFVIGSKGEVIIGRSLRKCEFTEEFLPNHSDVIVVGIGYCFNDDQTGDIRKSTKEFETVVKLLKYLQSRNLLSHEYELEILEECRFSQLVESLRSKLNISYYNYSDYLLGSGSGDLKKVSGSVYIGEEIDKAYWMKSPVRSVVNVANPSRSSLYEEVSIRTGLQIDSSLCNLGCREILSSMNSTISSQKTNFLVFLNGTSCAVLHKLANGDSHKGQTTNIFITDSCISERDVDLVWRHFIKYFFDLSKSVEPSSSTMCQYNKSLEHKILKTFLPLISLPFNARDVDKLDISNYFNHVCN